jgi:hypothetical protein
MANILSEYNYDLSIDFNNASIAFQIALLLYILVFLFVVFFAFKANPATARGYFIASMIICPLLGLIGLSFTAASQVKLNNSFSFNA